VSTVEAVNAQAQPGFPTPAEQSLLLRILITSRMYCMRPPPEQIDLNVPRENPVAAIVCVRTRGAGIVSYYQFSDHASMVANYQRSVMPGPACTSFPPDFTGEAEYLRGGTVAGRLLCNTNPSGSRYLSWIHDQLNIQVFAFNGYEPATLIS
jgi:hypothetical protein